MKHPASSLFFACAIVFCHAACAQGSATSSATGVVTAETFRDCPDCPAMVKIPAGDFTMGSVAKPRKRNEPKSIEEGPQHRVAIRAFALGQSAVTRREWAAFVAQTARPFAGGCAWSMLPGSSKIDATNERADWQHLGFKQADDHPAVCIGWSDAQDYARWLSVRTGHRYRLPSESEWEYAARAGSTTAYAWGETARRDRANYGADRCCSGLAKGFDRWTYTSPVDAFPANAFGLHDMSGNAMQWVQDCLSRTYAKAPADGSAYEVDEPLDLADTEFPMLHGQSSCAYRMLRGGNWGDTPDLIRSAYRNFGPPPGATLVRYRSSGGGVRVARDLDP